MNAKALLFAGLLILASHCPAAAQPRSAADADICQIVADAQEHAWNLPPQLLSSISKVESGRRLAGGRFVAWPWTVNVDGEGHYYETADAAILAVTKFKAAGSKSIDVGCNQVSLLHHPDAFASLQEAFDPLANATYAGRFLVQLHREFGDWSKAAAAYHSRTPELGDDYSRRVMQAWPLAGLFGLAVPDKAPVVHSLRNYTPAVLADARYVESPPVSRGALLSVSNVTRPSYVRLGQSQSWKSKLQKLAFLGSPGD